MTENLFDVLGVLTAFATVMLIFSIAVTSLVQATQGVFRWRARNLQNALAKIIESVRKDGDAEDPWKTAISLLNNADGSLLSTHFDPDGRLSRIFGPQLSWMEPDELDRELRKARVNLDQQQKAEVSKRFRRSQDTMCKLFLRRVRLGTLFWAVVVAFYYQLSAPQLLDDFSTDPALRDRAVQTGEALLDQPAGGDADSGYFELQPWRHELAFYFDTGREPGIVAAISAVQWNNVIGVAISVILLSMGAPFWFDVLKSIANLRDTLEKRKPASGESATEERRPSAYVDDRIDLLKERLLATRNPVLKASLQKEINDLRLVKAETG